MKKPNYAPLYCAIYPELAEVFHEHGYALAIHGSLARDFDLIGIPWIEEYSKPEEVVKDVTNRFAIKQVGESEMKPNNRLVFTVSVSYGACFMDLSFIMNKQDHD